MVASFNCSEVLVGAEHRETRENKLIASRLGTKTRERKSPGHHSPS